MENDFLTSLYNLQNDHVSIPIITAIHKKNNFKLLTRKGTICQVHWSLLACKKPKYQEKFISSSYQAMHWDVRENQAPIISFWMLFETLVVVDLEHVDEVVPLSNVIGREKIKKISEAALSIHLRMFIIHKLLSSLHFIIQP